MPKTVLITGSSTGIGMETALYFHERGWNVVATMRHPESRKTVLHEKENIDLLHLDVTDLESIRAAIKYTLDKYQRLDVLVNNAGYGVIGVFESTTREQALRQFNTNVFGLMDVTREIIPVMRKQKGGVIINITSIGGRMVFPLYSLYNSSKWALEGFLEGLHYELKQFNIQVKAVEPGLINTDFYGRSADITQKDGLDIYDDYIERISRNMEKSTRNGSHPKVIAKTIYQASTDGSWRLRYPTGKMAMLLLALRKLLPDRIFRGIIRMTMENR